MEVRVWVKICVGVGVDLGVGVGVGVDLGVGVGVGVLCGGGWGKGPRVPSEGPPRGGGAGRQHPPLSAYERIV